MRVTWNQKTNLPIVEFTEEDFSQAGQVGQMLEGKFMCRKCGTKNDNNAWKVLEGYFASMRLSIEEVGKAHARTRVKRELCSNDFSILDGFDIAVGIPRKVVLQANMMRESQKKLKEMENGTADDIND